MIGETLGSYRVTSRLGQGGMGAVYVAEHPLIGKKAAVKVLLPELSRDQDIVNRFFNEARAAALIKHPGIVDIFDFGYHASGCAYIAMEFLDGEAVAQRLRRERPMQAPLLAAIGRQIAMAVGAAHAQGIVHRDLKPDNVMLLADPLVAFGVRVKVLDFGIAKLAGDSVASSMTRTGSVLGTPSYMSPEQCRGSSQIDRRADVYSLGCILYEMASGRVPFDGEGVGDILGKHQYVAPTPPRTFNPAIPPELDALILRCLAKSPDERPQTMDEVGAVLERLAGVSMSGPMPAVSAPPGAPTIVPQRSTTLGSSVGQAVSVAPPARSRRTPLLVVAAVLILAGAGGGIYAITRGGGEKPATVAQGTVPSESPSPSPSPSPAPSPQTPTPTPTPDPTPDPTPTPAAEPPKPEPPKPEPPKPDDPRAAAYAEARKKITDLVAKQDCDGARRVVKKAGGELDPAAVRDLDKLASTCKPKPKESPAEPSKDEVAAAEKLIMDAQDAYVHGQYANALQLAKKAAKHRPAKAWRIVGASACFLKDRDQAVVAWNKLDSQGRQFLKYVCSRNGITVP